MNDRFRLSGENCGGVHLRAAQEKDCENLRAWKNLNREYFFFKDYISAEAQAEWFRGYLSRPDDFMFIVEHEGKDVGCMAFRIREGEADIYNVILGLPEYGGRGIMSFAMRIMCSFILKINRKAGAKVLKKNPALGWYKKNGFYEESESDDYVQIRFELKGELCRIQKVKI